MIKNHHLCMRRKYIQSLQIDKQRNASYNLQEEI